MRKQTIILILSVLMTCAFSVSAEARQISRSGALGAVFDNDQESNESRRDAAALNAAKLQGPELRPPAADNMIAPLRRETAGWNTAVPGMPTGTRALQAPLIQGPQSAVPASQQVREIEERIKLLKKIYADKAAAERASMQATQVSEPNSPPLNELPVQTPVPYPPSMAAENFVMPELESNASPPPIDLAERVLPEPVNALEMGNSLFMTGDVNAALHAYTSVERNAVTAFDAGWLDFMTAVCSRRTGDISTAESVFRDIANEKSNEPTVVAARHWLKYIEANQRTRQAFKQVDSELSELLERADQHAGN